MLSNQLNTANEPHTEDMLTSKLAKLLAEGKPEKYISKKLGINMAVLDTLVKNPDVILMRNRIMKENEFKDNNKFIRHMRRVAHKASKTVEGVLDDSKVPIALKAKTALEYLKLVGNLSGNFTMGVITDKVDFTLNTMREQD